MERFERHVPQHSHHFRFSNLMVANLDRSALWSGNTLLKLLLGAIVCGVTVSLVTGIIENPPEAFSIPEARYYGYPLVWRVTMTLQPDDLWFSDLMVDIIFWIVTSFAALVATLLISKRLSRNRETQ